MMSAPLATDPHLENTVDEISFSRRDLGKRLLLRASAIAVLLAAGKRDDVQAAPTTPWVLGGNTGVLTNGTEFLGTNNVAPLIFKTAAAANTPLERMRITPTGNIGIGTSAPSAKLQVYSTSYAIYGRHTGTSGAQPGVYGLTDATVANANGVLGVVNSPAPGIDSAGVMGQNKGTNGNGAGVRGSHAGSGYGVQGTSVSGYGLYGDGGYTGVHGQGGTTGVYGTSSNGAGVYGTSSASNGVRGISSSATSAGVYGDALKAGVYGRTSGTSSASYGVYGHSGSSPGYAGYFQGNARVTGTLSKGAGSFLIDHPLDPENKYLYHSFVESPDMMNVYNGNVTTDAKGEATVEMPAYFEALNRDFRYQLTTIGGYAPVYIAEEIAGNSFKIAGGKPGMKVSWQITGVRQDAFANANRIPVEKDKPKEERGTFLHPEALGKPTTMGVAHLHEPQAAPDNLPAAKDAEPPTPESVTPRAPGTEQ